MRSKMAFDSDDQHNVTNIMGASYAPKRGPRADEWQQHHRAAPSQPLPAYLPTSRQGPTHAADPSQPLFTVVTGQLSKKQAARRVAANAAQIQLLLANYKSKRPTPSAATQPTPRPGRPQAAKASRLRSRSRRLALQDLRALRGHAGIVRAALAAARVRHNVHQILRTPTIMTVT